MGIERPPFTRTKLDEERVDDKRRVFSVSVNEAEEKMLLELRGMFQVTSDGTALKLAAKVGRNVLHSTFGQDNLKHLFNKRRVRPE
ncbi:hypothetical protein LCGC14_0484860 [marine sediment metagenome]|uniref:Uncharacterized protein n=1 Tax=marine sediment metagenome TaxID=412755 RepID=A0A0F9VH09_9ZZZZ